MPGQAETNDEQAVQDPVHRLKEPEPDPAIIQRKVDRQRFIPEVSTNSGQCKKKDRFHEAEVFYIRRSIKLRFSSK